MQPTDVHNRIDELQLIDVREPDEWRAGHIAAARHIPMDQLPDQLDEIDRDRAVVTICRSGSRSGKMAELLRERGYDADNMDGGMQAWDQAGLAYVADDRESAEVI
jgi:rhodanese-related sulfurtransferase